MSKLQAALDEYLAVHRVLGYKLRLAGRLLQHAAFDWGEPP